MGMKRAIICCTLFLIGCTIDTRNEWDSGADAQRAYQQQRMEENSENLKNQFPTSAPATATESPQPF
jgi:hypothetical protein